MPRATIPSLLNKTLSRSLPVMLTSLAMILQQGASEAAVTAGGIAIVGYTDQNDSIEDTFSIATLESIAAGTTVYFTDNGWNTADGKFRGANNSDGDGNERLMQLYFSSSVAAGTVLRSGNDTAEAQWGYLGTIPGAVTDTVFEFLNLDPTTGEQIYAFEADNSLPLLNVTNHIYLLDFGDYVNSPPVFEDASDNATGNIAPGLSVVANTAVSLPDDSGLLGDPDDFHGGSFALNMADSDVVALNLAGGTKAQWLAIIANSANWMRDNYVAITHDSPDAEAQLQNLTIAGVPEPSRGILLAAGVIMAGLRRRRTR